MCLSDLCVADPDGSTALGGAGGEMSGGTDTMDKEPDSGGRDDSMGGVSGDGGPDGSGGKADGGSDPGSGGKADGGSDPGSGGNPASGGNTTGGGGGGANGGTGGIHPGTSDDCTLVLGTTGEWALTPSAIATTSGDFDRDGILDLVAAGSQPTPG